MAHDLSKLKNHRSGKPRKIKESDLIDIKDRKKFNGWLWLGLIWVLIFIVYCPILNNKFTNWDDPTYLLNNPLIRTLSVGNLKKIFSEVYFANFQPLHIFSYALEYQFYKLNPAGYHATSLVMHLIVTALVCWFIWLLTENTGMALITTLLFGIHPLHVESVAWAAERKDLLYSVFFVAAMITYVNYIRSGENIKYLSYTFLLFVFSVLSKTMAVSLVPVMFLLDFYLGRKTNAKMFLEKFPFVALALGLGLYSVHAATASGSVGTHVFGLGKRILIAEFNLLAYVFKLLAPVQLSAFYPYPSDLFTGTPFYFLAAPLVIVAILVLIIRSMKLNKVYMFAAGFFVATIFLILQLLPVGPAIFAERYSYMPSIGLFFMLSCLLLDVSAKGKGFLTAAGLFLSAYVLFLSITTYKRCDVWKDSISLWSNVIEQFPHCGMALNNLGNVYGKELGQLDKAMEKYNESIAFDPNFEFAYVNRGIIYCMTEKYTLGIKDFSFALSLRNDYFDARVNRAIAYAKSGELSNGIADFTEIIRLKQENFSVYLDRGRAYSQSKKYDEALADFNTANALDSMNAEVYYQMAIALYNKKRYKESLNKIDKAASLGYHTADVFQTIRQAAEK